MKLEDAIKSAAGFFLVILAGTLLAALLGGGFAALIAIISPEFVTDLFALEAGPGLVRYAFAVGMIWGLFIGVGVSGFACFLAAVIKILKIRFEYQKGQADGS